MTEETRCPACGAPLVFSGDQDVIRCTFCGTELKVTREDDHVHFQVLAQPGPQKEVLDQPVEPASGTPGGARVYPETPLMGASVGEPFPSQPGPSGAPVYPVPGGGQVEKRVVNRWVWVGIALLIGLGLFCICAIMIVLAVFRMQGRF